MRVRSVPARYDWCMRVRARGVWVGVVGRVGVGKIGITYDNCFKEINLFGCGVQVKANEGVALLAP